jgi:phosphoribosyl 1,2-cyclic phosphodiesterase
MVNNGTPMVIKYWGVRGSIPTPLTKEEIRKKQKQLIGYLISNGQSILSGASDNEIEAFLDTLPFRIGGTYGGNTTCIEVQANDSPLIVFDAGTGIRLLGKELMKNRLFLERPNLNPLSSREQSAKEIDLFFTHCHWDHIQGFPFFDPAFIPDVSINFYGKKDTREHLSDVLRRQQRDPTFPVEWEAMPCKKEYIELPRFNGEPVCLGDATVSYCQLDHPNGGLAYSVEAHTKKFVCATDTEHRDIPDPDIVKLAENADVLYYDTQYTPEEYAGGNPELLTGALHRVKWGHSTYKWAIITALAANVKTVVLGHHEPLRDDEGLVDLRDKAEYFAKNQLKLPENKGKKLEVVMAYEGLEQRLEHNQ